jgi:hypothetical protein
MSPKQQGVPKKRFVIILACTLAGALIGLANFGGIPHASSTTDPLGKTINSLFHPISVCFSVFGFLIGAGTGAAVGSLICAFTIGDNRMSRTAGGSEHDFQSPQPHSRPDSRDVPPGDNRDAEIMRLKERVEELERAHEQGTAEYLEEASEFEDLGSDDAIHPESD